MWEPGTLCLRCSHRKQQGWELCALAREGEAQRGEASGFQNVSRPVGAQLAEFPAEEVS